MTLQTIILIQNVIYYVLSACAFSLVFFGWFLAVIFGTCVFLVMVLSGVVMTFGGGNFPWGWFWGLIFLGGGFWAIWVDSKLIPLS